MIRAITFDLDGVYFINGKSNFVANLGKFGVSENEAKRVFLQSDEMNKMYKEGKMTDDEFWSWALKEWKLNLTVLEIIKLLIDGYEVDEKVVEVVKKVKANGYKTLICSNNFPARINGLQNRFGFLENFDAWALSYEIGSAKPSVKIFEELVKKSGVKPEEIIYADDNEDALTGAKEIGIQAFLFEGFDKFLEKFQELGVDLK